MTQLSVRLGVVLALLAGAFELRPGAATVDFDIVYVRAPRFGDTTRTKWPEANAPYRLDAGADLVLLHPDGKEEVLVSGGAGAVTDPFVSFDAKYVYYAYFPNPSQVGQHSVPVQGSDIYRINLQTRAIERLTHQEFTPNTGAGSWDVSPSGSGSKNGLGYGILNLSPIEVAGGKLMFVSNRNGFVPPKDLTFPTLQLYVMDRDGENVTPIAPMVLGSALHPYPLMDGSVMFSSYETQGLRDGRLWGMWTIRPDGTMWQPLMSAFHYPQVLHFSTQLSGGDIVVEDYYNLNNNGFGLYYRFPMSAPGQVAFHSAVEAENPRLEQTLPTGNRTSRWMPFSPQGIFSMTPMTSGTDFPAPKGVDGSFVGKFTHPAVAPRGDMLTVYTPGPANAKDGAILQPYFDAGLYLIRGARGIEKPSDLVLIKNDPKYNEVWPRAVLSYRALYGIDQPKELPWLPNDGTKHPELPAGTPYGIVGTSSFYKRESWPGVSASRKGFGGLDEFNTTSNDQNSNWLWQGAESGKYTNAEIHAVRIVTLEPTSDRRVGPNAGQHFFNRADERMRILGEIPLRKSDGGRPVLDPEGNPDTSFAAKIPADTPFTFQMIDKDGMVLTSAQTWHQVRPGEVRTDCGGCHAHSKKPLEFSRTAAGQPGYKVVDLTKQVPLLSHNSSTGLKMHPKAVDVEFYRDIRPILQRSCVSCHTKTASEPPGRLVLDDLTAVDGFPGDYVRLARDTDAKYGIPPVVKVGGQPRWRQFNTSRYVRAFQSRRSLLAWKVFGRRLDGWTNADHPTETVPGDAATIPAGFIANDVDIDYTGSMMPPPGSSVPPLTHDEKMTIARWIDLGSPIDLATGTARAGLGWFLDELRPTLTISSPRENRNSGPLTEIRLGVADYYSGIDPATLSVVADVALAGKPAGTELATLGGFVGDGIYAIRLNPPITALPAARLTVKIRDKSGNETVQRVRFSVGASAGPQTLVGAAVLSEPMFGTTIGVEGASRVRASRDVAPAPVSAISRNGGFESSATLVTESPSYLATTVVVKFKDDRARLSASSPFEVMPITGGTDAEVAARQFAARPDVEFAQARYRIHPQGRVRNGVSGGSRSQPEIKALWRDAARAPAIKVAVLDTGVAFTGAITRHYEGREWRDWNGTLWPSLPNTAIPFAASPKFRHDNLFVAPSDLIWGDDYPLDLDGHGTFLAARLAELTQLGDGTPGVQLMPIKVVSSLWDHVFAGPVEGVDDTLALGIRQAVAAGARVLMIGAGRAGPPSQVVNDALADAVARGAFVVVAAGSEFTAGAGAVGIAALAPRLDGVLAVGAVDESGGRAPYSSRGQHVEIMASDSDVGYSYDLGMTETFGRGPRHYGAPRFDVFGPQVMEGTSIGMPEVAALGSFLMRKGITNPATIEWVIKRSASDRHTPGRDDDSGYGMVDAAAALRLASSLH